MKTIAKKPIKLLKKKSLLCVKALRYTDPIINVQIELLRAQTSLAALIFEITYEEEAKVSK